MKSNASKGSVKQRFSDYIKNNKIIFPIYVVLTLFTFVVMLQHLIKTDYQKVFLCILVFVFLMTPALIEKKFNIKIPILLKIIIFSFVFGSSILGEIEGFYIKFYFWDVILHLLSGFMCGAIGFGIIHIFHKKKSINMNSSLRVLTVFAFCFAITCGVLWEIFEFGADILFNQDMQTDTIVHKISSVTLNKDESNIPTIVDNITEVDIYTANGQKITMDGYLDIGIIDTMKDFIMDSIGAIVFCFIAWFCIKKNEEGKFVKLFIPTIE